MGLDSFNTSGRRTYTKGSQMSGQKLKNADHAVECMKQIRDIIGHIPTSTEWNENKSNIGITTNSSTFKPVLGYTYSEIKDMAGYSEPTTHKDISRGLLSEILFEDEADAYVYTLICEHVDTGEQYYYVGATLDIHDRIFRHVRYSGQFNGIDTKCGKKVMARGRNIDYKILDILNIKHIHNTFDSDEDMRSRMKYLERKTAMAVAIEHNTTNVLGGFSTF